MNDSDKQVLALGGVCLVGLGAYFLFKDKEAPSITLKPPLDPFGTPGTMSDEEYQEYVDEILAAQTQAEAEALRDDWEGRYGDGDMNRVQYLDLYSYYSSNVYYMDLAYRENPKWGYAAEKMANESYNYGQPLPYEEVYETYEKYYNKYKGVESEVQVQLWTCWDVIVGGGAAGDEGIWVYRDNKWLIYNKDWRFNEVEAFLPGDEIWAYAIAPCQIPLAPDHKFELGWSRVYW